MNIPDYHLEKAYVFFRWKCRNRRNCDISSNLYVLSVKRAETRSDDRRVGYYWFVDQKGYYYIIDEYDVLLGYKKDCKVVIGE